MQITLILLPAVILFSFGEVTQMQTPIMQQLLISASASVRQAQIACALEAYRDAKGGFPNDLSALAPKWIEKVPTDPMGGNSFRYQLEKKKYALYSIGWNLTDDGGKIISEPNVPLLDWVWSYPERIMSEPFVSPPAQAEPVPQPVTPPFS